MEMSDAGPAMKRAEQDHQARYQEVTIDNRTETRSFSQTFIPTQVPPQLQLYDMDTFRSHVTNTFLG
jgi:hypothetical protein